MPPLRLHLLQPLPGGPYHLHPVHIVRRAVIGAPAVIVMHKIVRRILKPDIRAEDRRLVHVVPHAGHPLRQIVRIEPAPPGAHVGAGEIGKITLAGPDLAFVVGAIGTLHVEMPTLALLAHRRKTPAHGRARRRLLRRIGRGGDRCRRRLREPLVALQAGVDHPHGVEIERVQIVVEPFRIGKPSGIEGENPEVIHVIDVEPDDIARNAPDAKLTRDLPCPIIRRVAPAALLKTERPLRRQRHPAGQLRQRLHHRGRSLALNRHNRKLRAVRLHPDLATAERRQRDRLPVSGVEDQAKSRAVGTHAEHPRMRLVERGRLGVVAIDIAIPERDRAPVAQQRPAHLARPVQRRARGHLQRHHLAPVDRGKLRPQRHAAIALRTATRTEQRHRRQRRRARFGRRVKHRDARRRRLDHRRGPQAGPQCTSRQPQTKEFHGVLEFPCAHPIPPPPQRRACAHSLTCKPHTSHTRPTFAAQGSS